MHAYHANGGISDGPLSQEVLTRLLLPVWHVVNVPKGRRRKLGNPAALCSFKPRPLHLRAVVCGKVGDVVELEPICSARGCKSPRRLRLCDVAG